MLVPQLVELGVVELTTSTNIKSASQRCGSQTRSSGAREREVSDERGSSRSCTTSDFRKTRNPAPDRPERNRPTSAATALAFSASPVEASEWGLARLTSETMRS